MLSRTGKAAAWVILFASAAIWMPERAQAGISTAVPEPCTEEEWLQAACDAGDDCQEDPNGPCAFVFGCIGYYDASNTRYIQITYTCYNDAPLPCPEVMLCM